MMMMTSPSSFVPTPQPPLRRLHDVPIQLLSFIFQPPLHFTCPHTTLTNMFTHNSNGLPYPYHDYTSGFSGNFFPSPAGTPSRTPPLSIPKHDSVSMLRPEMGYTSGCSSHGCSPSSITSNGAFSSHSLQTYASSSLSTYFESETCSSVRKAMSSDDLHIIQSVNLAHNNPGSNSDEMSILESMNRASPYSPEEKKERIQRYRSKRNLRNFNKKIKYECRKTLADSRRRIRGRFARNDEIEKMTHQSEWDYEYDEDSDNWINIILDTFSANMMP